MTRRNYFYEYEVRTIKKILQVLAVAAMLASLNSCTVSKSDLYGDRLVYDKSDSSLFSGTVETLLDGWRAEQQFCGGMPCGKWSGRGRDGELIMGGEYLKLNAVLSDKSMSLIKGDTLSIDYWREGDLPYVTVTVLKPDTFFYKGNEGRQGAVAMTLAASIGTDLTNKGYEYNSLKVHFVSGFLDPTKFVDRRYIVQWGEAQESE
jgi:hypothetical protein